MHADIIDRLGGHKDLSERLQQVAGAEFKLDTVYRWRKDGIPWRWRAHVVRLAKEKGVALPDDFLPGVETIQ